MRCCFAGFGMPHAFLVVFLGGVIHAGSAGASSQMDAQILDELLSISRAQSNLGQMAAHRGQSDVVRDLGHHLDVDAGVSEQAATDLAQLIIPA